MSRGFKCRRVCAEPENKIFNPERPCGVTVTLAVEELETLRLCDLEGLDQDAAAGQMNVSRGTLQRMLYDARRKVADTLCAGKTLVIGGGNYEVTQRRCGCREHCSFEQTITQNEKEN